MKWTLTPQTSSMGTRIHLWMEICVSFRVINEISIKGAATDLIIYQIVDINVNIYDISLYLEWTFERKRKEPKEKEYKYK